MDIKIYNLSLRQGYTFMELLTAIIIVSIITSIALPSYLFYLEKAKVSEGIQILDALRSAQKTYYGEKFTYTNNLADLEVSFASSQNFDAPTVNDVDPIASVQRKSSYTLSIDNDGTIHCSGGPSDYCTKLGY